MTLLLLLQASRLPLLLLSSSAAQAAPHRSSEVIECTTRPVSTSQTADRARRWTRQRAGIARIVPAARTNPTTLPDEPSANAVTVKWLLKAEQCFPAVGTSLLRRAQRIGLSVCVRASFRGRSDGRPEVPQRSSCSQARISSRSGRAACRVCSADLQSATAGTPHGIGGA